MKITTTQEALSKVSSDCLALAVTSAALKKGSTLDIINSLLGGEVKKLFSREKFTGQKGESKLIRTYNKSAPAVVWLYGLGQDSTSVEDVRRFAGRAVRFANSLKANHLSIEIFNPSKRVNPAERIQATVEGLVLANYQFAKYKNLKESEKNSVIEATLGLSEKRLPPGAQKVVSTGLVVAEATNLARDLINTPASDLTPSDLAAAAKKVAGEQKLSIRVYNKAEIQKMKMESFLYVSRGSTEAPAFIHLTYHPKGRKNFKHVALVGKGITFDSGGLSLKPSTGMEDMKGDMSGAAGALGIIKAASLLNLAVGLDVYIAATENMPSGSAGKVGDVVRAVNGKTIEVLNTDAEGRLTLADAYGIALKKKPDYLLELSTLTGACVVALGTLCSGIMGNDSKMTRQLLNAAEASGEKLWELPLIEEYGEDLKSPIADLKNVGNSRWGGTIRSAIFLKEFIDGHKHWSHIDIAGPFMTDKALDYFERGATGPMVRTVVKWLQGLS